MRSRLSLVVSFTTVILFLAALQLPASTPSQEKAPADSVEELKSKLKQLEGEIQNLKQKMQTGESDPARALEKAMDAFRSGSDFESRHLYRQAIGAYGESVRLDPGNDTALQRRGDCFFQLGEFARAEAEYTRSLAIQPNNSRVIFKRASARFALGEALPAMDDVNEAIERDSRGAESFLLRARLKEIKGDGPGAAADYKAASAIDPKRLGQPVKFEAALADCEESIRVDSTTPHAYLCRAELFRRVRTAGTVIASVEAVPLKAVSVTTAPRPKVDPLAPLERTPITVEAKGKALRQQQAGRAVLNSGKFADAIVLLNDAVALDPSLALGFNARGYAHLRMKHFALALADFDEALRLNPKYSNAAHNRAVAKRLTGDYEGAVRDEKAAEEFAGRRVVYAYDEARRGRLAQRQNARGATVVVASAGH